MGMDYSIHRRYRLKYGEKFFFDGLILALNIIFRVCFLTKPIKKITISKKKKFKKILNKKTIVQVREGEGGPWGMVKEHTFALLNFLTLPLLIS